MSSMWDVFHSVRLEVERGVATEAVRSRLADGTLTSDDLIRPSGTTRWSRIAQVAALQATEPPPAPAPEVPPTPEPPVVEVLSPVVTESTPIRLVPLLEPTPDLEFPPEEEDNEAEEANDTTVELPAIQAGSATAPPLATPVLPDDEAGGPDPPELDDPLAPELETEHDAEDDPASDFTLTRNSTETVEELDLAAMVDVAFQLVLFFLVTASTVVFKTFEIPRPNEDKPPEAAAQSRAKSMDELEKDFILVEVDAEGAVKIDHLPVPADRAALIEKLRTARESTGRKEMLLSTDATTRHKNAVLALDVASEIDLQIAIAQPAAKN